MAIGYVKLHRKLLNSRVQASPNLLAVWIYCLLKASRKDRWVGVKTGRGQTTIKLKSGQFICGRKMGSEETHLKPTTFAFCLRKLFTFGNIDISNMQYCSIISINKWNEYQDIDRRLTGDCQAIDTDKNVKNVKNNISSVFNKLNTSDNSDVSGVSKETYPIPKYPVEKKKLTPIQKIVLCYKQIKGFKENDKGWDKLNFARCCKSAKQLLDYFGKWQDVVDCIESLAKKFNEENLKWTIETIVKHCADWKLEREKED